ncbi:hypothetical protein [Mameliella alba]|uniref:hypothetical protein n=1 Tax=Mameliella alba TaxID=561184 RepID=UPI000B52E879|nr:hypothetical protein [Mameliella alba]OWV43213.1 hypothetical protein CDZ95_10500 [Mameliella alba]BBU57420.1 hypothetical protein KU6B_36850 [Mameliella alba]
MPDTPMTEAEMLAKAGSAIAKIDRSGLRGASMVTMEETIAMAALIECPGAGPLCQRAYHEGQIGTVDAARAAGVAL